MTDNAGNNGSDSTQVQVIGEAHVIVISQGSPFLKFKHLHSKLMQTAVLIYLALKGIV